MYSAIKKNGQKLYELARRGQEVEREPRPVIISALEILEQEGPADFRMRVVCSKAVSYTHLNINPAYLFPKSQKAAGFQHFGDQLQAVSPLLPAQKVYLMVGTGIADR